MLSERKTFRTSSPLLWRVYTFYNNDILIFLLLLSIFKVIGTSNILKLLSLRVHSLSQSLTLDLPSLTSMHLGSRTFQNVMTLIIDSNGVFIDITFRDA